MGTQQHHYNKVQQWKKLNHSGNQTGCKRPNSFTRSSSTNSVSIWSYIMYTNLSTPNMMEMIFNFTGKLRAQPPERPKLNQKICPKTEMDVWDVHISCLISLCCRDVAAFPDLRNNFGACINIITDLNWWPDLQKMLLLVSVGVRLLLLLPLVLQTQILSQYF